MNDTTATTAAAATAATTAAATTAAATTASTPWHTGVDAEMLGHWQNKGWKVDDPKEIALAATKQARELERHFGVPADQLLKMPKADAAPADIKAFWARLGAGEPKDYDLSGVKLNGQPLDEALSGAMREALAQAFVPKDKAITIAAAVAKHLESGETAKATVTAAKVAEEKAKLKTDWGPNYEFNLLKAMEGARRLGPAFVTALENAKDSPGYAAIMDGMRRIGVGTSEDNFVERGTGSNGNPTTREGAVARKAELMADKAWGARLQSRDAQAMAEWKALNTMIDGDS